MGFRGSAVYVHFLNQFSFSIVKLYVPKQTTCRSERKYQTVTSQYFLSSLLEIIEFAPKGKAIMSSALQKWRNLSISMKFMIRNGIANHRLLHDGPDTLEELLDRHVVKTDKSLDDEEEELLNRRRLTSTRREALQLYRDILRATRFFTWADSRGFLWRDILRQNARKEFDEARFELDPEVINRLLIGGRDAVDSALEKLVEKQRQLVEKERGGVGDRH